VSAAVELADADAVNDAAEHLAVDDLDLGGLP
jgi:hypothetical protein